MREYVKKNIPLGICLFLVFLACSYWSSFVKLLSLVLDAAFPFIMGAAIAYIVNILMSFYEQSTKGAIAKSRRPVCMIGAYLTVVLILVLAVWLVIPQLIAGIQTFSAQVPSAIEKFLEVPVIAGHLPEDWTGTLETMDWELQIAQWMELLKSGVMGALENAPEVISTVFSSVVSWLFAIVFSFYVLWGKEKLASQCRSLLTRYLKPSWKEKILCSVDILNTCFHKYIVGQCLESVILGVLCTLGMLIFQFPYAVMIGVLVGILALVPIVGAYVGAGGGAILILSVSPEKAIFFVIFILILQQIEGNFIYPRVVGASVGCRAYGYL